MTSDAYLATGTRLRVDCRAGGASKCNDLVTIESATLVREDGVTVDLEEEQVAVAPSGYAGATKPVDLGAPMPIGEVAVGNARKVTLRVSVQGDGEAGETRLYFTASAWNAHSASVSVGVGSGDATVQESGRPANDAFASATVIEGEEGSLAVDLLHATPEPGEPVFDARLGRPAASVWYRWTAPADGAFRFRVPALAADYRQQDDVARYDRVHVFAGDEIAALHEVASELWHATFFAEQGSTYRIRVSGVSRAARMDLRWSPGDRPVNDDFAEAVVLAGESGTFDGSSGGATLEPGESFGAMAATTWFRWVAPDDGRWEFRSSRAARACLCGRRHRGGCAWSGSPAVRASVQVYGRRRQGVPHRGGRDGTHTRRRAWAATTRYGGRRSRIRSMVTTMPSRMPDRWATKPRRTRSSTSTALRQSSPASRRRRA